MLILTLIPQVYDFVTFLKRLLNGSTDISPSGNMHGMPIGFLMNVVNPKEFHGLEWMTNVLGYCDSFERGFPRCL